MIAVTDVAKIYDNGRETSIALDRVSVDVSNGEFVVVGGHSGAGKSTLLAVMGGLLRPSSGSVLLDGSPVWEIDERARASLRAAKIGFVFQNAAVIRSLTAMENVLLAATFLPHSTDDGPQRALELLEMVGLREKAAAYPRQLSGGERRRVAIAGALMNRPRLLLADEPTGDLDEANEQMIVDIFRRLHQDDGMTAVVVTHSRAFDSVADRTLLLRNGRIVNGRS